MTTKICGYDWISKQEAIDELFARLQSHPLDRTFEDERFGGFIYQDAGNTEITYFFGNFATYSHVFNIRSDDPEFVNRLTTAIRANQQRPDYISQQTYAEQEAESAAHAAEARAHRQAAEESRARAVLNLA